MERGMEGEQIRNVNESSRTKLNFTYKNNLTRIFFSIISPSSSAFTSSTGCQCTTRCYKPLQYGHCSAPGTLVPTPHPTTTKSPTCPTISRRLLGEAEEQWVARRLNAGCTHLPTLRPTTLSSPTVRPVSAPTDSPRSSQPSRAPTDSPRSSNPSDAPTHSPRSELG